MISLACKTISFEELIRCAFNINKTEYEVFKKLIDDKLCSSEDIQKTLNKDLTTIQRSLKSLSQKNLVERKQINLDKGGYKYYYTSIPKDEIRKAVLGNLDNFREKVEQKIAQL